MRCVLQTITIILFLLARSLDAAPFVFVVDDAAPTDAELAAIQLSHPRIQQKTGNYACYVYGEGAQRLLDEFRENAQSPCDLFYVVREGWIEFEERDDPYANLSLTFDAMRDAQKLKYDWGTMDYEPTVTGDEWKAQTIHAFADRYIQYANYPTLYYVRELYDEATAPYVLSFIRMYLLAMLLSLVPSGFYLLYRLLTRNLSISWRWHFAAAPFVPLVLLLLFVPVGEALAAMDLHDALIVMPMIACGYAFAAFAANFLICQRWIAGSSWPPYWVIALLYILAPLAVFAAGGARGAVGSGSSAPGSSSSGKATFKAGGGTFGGGGASGGW